MRLKRKTEKAHFQKRKPGISCRLRNTAIIPKRREIQKLSDTTSAEPDKTIKEINIANVHESTHISFNVGFIILLKPLLRSELFIVNTGIATSKELCLE